MLGVGTFSRSSALMVATAFGRFRRSMPVNWPVTTTSSSFTGSRASATSTSRRWPGRHCDFRAPIADLADDENDVAARRVGVSTKLPFSRVCAELPPPAPSRPRRRSVHRPTNR